VIDLDKCLDASGTLTTEAAAIVARFNGAAYIERSRSSRGLHLWIRGTLPPGGRRRGSIEAYSSGRFVICTGYTVSSTPLVDSSRELARFHAEIFPTPSGAPETFTTSCQPPAIAPEELLTRCLKDSRFRALHERGDLTAYSGDKSAADLAYISLIRANGGQPSQADALYRSSAIARSKWSERRGERGTYGAITLSRAFDGAIVSSTPTFQLERLRPPATGEPGEVAALRAANAELTQQLAKCSAAKDALAARLLESERRLALLSQVQSGSSGILRNTALRGSCRTAIAVTNRLANWEASGDTGDSRGFHPLRIAGPDGLAEASGASAATVSKHLGQLEQGGFISREVRTIPEATDSETGEIKAAHRLTYVAPKYSSTLAMIDALAKHTPARAHKDGTADKGWGGARPACPLHPDAGTVRKWTLHCAACDVLLEAGTEALAPTFQVGRLGTDALAPKFQHDILSSEAKPTFTAHVLGATDEECGTLLIPSIPDSEFFHNEQKPSWERPRTRPGPVWLGP
jgi:hypothetical protein